MIKIESTGAVTANLKVNFRLDENGKPMFIGQGPVKHYKIHISVENFPDDVYSVNYQLHPSYISPFREERNRTTSFGFNTTTYGDYIISAEMMGKKGNQILSTLVSESLEKSHPEPNQFIQEALNTIKEA